MAQEQLAEKQASLAEAQRKLKEVQDKMENLKRQVRSWDWVVMFWCRIDGRDANITVRRENEAEGRVAEESRRD